MSINDDPNMTGKELPNDFEDTSWGKSAYDVSPNDIMNVPIPDSVNEVTDSVEDDEVIPVQDGGVDVIEPPVTPQSFGSWYNAQSDDGQVQSTDGDTVPSPEGFGYAPMSSSVTATPEPAQTMSTDRPPVPNETMARTARHQQEEPLSYAPQRNPYEGYNPYDNHEHSKKKGRHLPWLIGGIAVGAIVMGLGLGATGFLSKGADPSVPDHTTTQWEGTSEEKPADKTSSESDGTTPVMQESPTLASEVAEKSLPSVVAIHTSEGMGSGVIIDADGHVLTNSHVVKDMSEIVIVSGDGEEYEAELLGLDDSSDLAVLNVDWGNTEVSFMEYGDSSNLKVGDWVMTIGSPYGLDQSVSTGIVSALSRNQMMESYGGYRIYANLIQTDAAINLGNSGGALVNASGQLVGINSMLASNSGSYSAVGFAIPSNYAKRVADQIIAGKDVEHAYIGAQFSNVSRLSMKQKDSPYGTVVDESGQEVKEQDGTPTTGAYVAGVVDDSPAKEAGLQEGDIITKFGNERINSASGVILAVRSHEIGETVPVTVWRDGEEVTLDVTLGSDAGKGLYDNDDNSARQQQQNQYPSPYGGYDEEMGYLKRLFEQFGLSGN